MFIAPEELEKNMESTLNLTMIAIISPTLAVVLLILIIIIVTVAAITIGKKKKVHRVLDIRENSACMVGINHDAEPLKAVDNNICT